MLGATAAFLSVSLQQLGKDGRRAEATKGSCRQQPPPTSKARHPSPGGSARCCGQDLGIICAPSNTLTETLQHGESLQTCQQAQGSADDRGSLALQATPGQCPNTHVAASAANGRDHHWGPASKQARRPAAHSSSCLGKAAWKETHKTTHKNKSSPWPPPATGSYRAIYWQEKLIPGP